MYEELNGKVAIVTGGSSGIGRAIARRFAQEGMDVVITGRHEDALKEVVSAEDKIRYLVADNTSGEDNERLVEFVKKSFGRLDVLVNCAGWCPVQDIKHITVEDYDRAFNLDARAVVDLTSRALPMLLESKGSIINMSSIGATHPGRNLSMYAGAKAAVEAFTKTWGVELAADGVRVNAIAPGATESNIWDVPGLTEEQSAAHRAGIEAGIPMGRMADPSEIASVAAFLASDQASYVTSSVFKVDGGLAV
jgi:NAD(P)-dependent dehydrogenase (short-subunit alcohol dehydrogenase family)